MAIKVLGLSRTVYQLRPHRRQERMTFDGGVITERGDPPSKHSHRDAQRLTHKDCAATWTGP